MSGSGWQNFDEAKASYDRVVPGETSTAELREYGFEPQLTPNLRRLNYVELIEVFLPHPSIGPEDLDPALRRCFDMRDACYAYEVRPGVSHSRRRGNIALDLLGFRRTTLTSGWQFRSLIVINGEVVAYKLWSGEPRLESEEVERTPLGPFQNAGRKLLDNSVD